MSVRARAALVLLAVLVTAGPAAGAPPPATQAPAPQPADGVAQTTPASPETTFVVTLRPDGDARWTVRMNFSVGTPARRAAFQSLAEDFESGGDLRTLTAVRQASAEASRTTGREMDIVQVRRSSRSFNTTGQLRLSFTWTNFSSRSGRILQAGDAFNTTGESWLRSLDGDQALVVVPPEGYRLVGATPAGYQVSSGSLRWNGPRNFRPGSLSVRYRGPDGSSGGLPLPAGTELLGGAAVLVGALGAAAYLLRRRDVGLPIPTTTGDGTSSADEDPPTEGPAGNGATPTAANGEAIDEELLSDEERIERLLERNGGRMKQANIVTETGWSNAKVSQLLSTMDDEDRIDKLRIGRENLISFPEEDVADIDDEDD